MVTALVVCMPLAVNKFPYRSGGGAGSPSNLEFRSQMLPSTTPTMPDDASQQDTAQSPSVIVSSVLRQCNLAFFSDTDDHDVEDRPSSSERHETTQRPILPNRRRKPLVS